MATDMDPPVGMPGRRSPPLPRPTTTGIDQGALAVGSEPAGEMDGARRHDSGSRGRSPVMVPSGRRSTSAEAGAGPRGIGSGQVDAVPSCLASQRRRAARASHE